MTGERDSTADPQSPAEPRHLPRHLLEASTVSAFRTGHQVELQLGHVCNNRCVFCVSGQLTEQRIAKPIATEQILAAITEARESGARRLTFLGGEPTVHKSFLPALTHAVELGFEDLVIFTNGVKTRKRDWIDKVRALGRFEWRFSIQGGDEASHDRVTGRRGSFQRILDGMTYLAELGEDITANCCVNEHSYESLPKFLELARRYNIRQLHFDQIRPEDAGARTREYLASIIPRYSLMAPRYAEMLDRFDAWKPDFDINIGNFPFCLLPDHADKVHHDGELTFTISVDPDMELQPAFDKYANKREDKFHPPQCAACVFRSRCNGVFELYDELHGSDEFQPITRELLAEGDPELRHFTLLAEPWLAPLLPVLNRVGHPVRVDQLDRDRRLDLVQTRPDGAEVRLMFGPPDGLGAPVSRPTPVLTGARLALSVAVAGAVPPDEVVALAQLAESTLRDAGEAFDGPLDAARLGAALGGGDRASRGLRRVHRLVSRLQARDTYGVYRYAGTQDLPGGGGASVSLSGPSGTALVLELSVQTEPGKPLVGFGYTVSDRAPEATAREALSLALATLKGDPAQAASSSR